MNILKKAVTFLLQIIIIPTIILLAAACSQNKTNTPAIEKAPEEVPEEAPATATKSKDSTVVFSRIGQGEVTIDNEYCRQLDEPTRAILLYYANKFSTGFDHENNSLLTVALESKGKALDGEKLIEKWFKGNDLVKLEDANVSAVLPDGATNATWFTLISVVKDNDIRRVYFRTLDTDNEEKYREATDVFQISGDHIQVIKVHDFGELADTVK